RDAVLEWLANEQIHRRRPVEKDSQTRCYTVVVTVVIFGFVVIVMEAAAQERTDRSWTYQAVEPFQCVLLNDAAVGFHHDKDRFLGAVRRRAQERCAHGAFVQRSRDGLGSRESRAAREWY